MSYIYKTTNSVNGKIYIGKSKINNPTYLGSGSILKTAILKYGKEAFIKEIIEECDDSVVNEREIYFINLYGSNQKEIGYNIAVGGAGGDTTTHHPNKTDIISRRGDSLKKWHKNLTEGERIELNKKISEGKKGKGNGRMGFSNTPQTIEKMRRSAKKRTPSQSWKDAHAKAMKKREGIPLTKKNKKVIVNEVEYPSVNQACKCLGLKYRRYFYNGIKNGTLRVEYK